MTKESTNINPAGNQEPQGLVDSALVSVTRIMQARADLAERPATEEQLTQIWPAWNALPDDLQPEEKRKILTATFYDRNQSPAENQMRDRHAKLKAQFAYLPLDRYEYNLALLAAHGWSSLRKYIQTTFDLHKSIVESQLDYSTFDDLVTGRVAIYRVVKELEITQPDLLRCRTPNLDQIHFLESRYAAYSRARSDAVDLLHPLVFPSGLHSERELSFEEQAFGLPHPPEKFPAHIYIARLAAFGKCTPQRLAEFFAESFLKLSRAQMDEFCEEFHRPAKGREGKYFFLAVWMADNAPVFNAFKLTWADILKTAKQFFNNHAREGYRDTPESADNLKVFWKYHEDRLWSGQPRRITPPTGHPRATDSGTVPAGLLTPLPFVRPGRKG
jgi:hypothetical protein